MRIENNFIIMAKNNPLSYIRRYINSFDNVKIKKGTNSTYHIIDDDIHIRVSNHNKKITKDYNKNDIDIVQAVNNDKLYIITIKYSLGNLILDLNGAKEFIRNFILMKKLNVYSKAFISFENNTQSNRFGFIETNKIKEVDKAMLIIFISEKYKWYSTMTDGAKRKFKEILFGKEEMLISDLDKFIYTNIIPNVKDKIKLKKKIEYSDIVECFKEK